MLRNRNSSFYITVAVIFGSFVFITFYISDEVKLPQCFKNEKTYIPDAYTLEVRKRMKDLKSLRLPPDTRPLRPFLKIKSYYRLAPRYDLTLCLVEKAMCSIMQSIFCYLYDTDGFIANNRSIHTDRFIGRYCIDRNEVKSTQEKYLRMPFNPSTIFIVRNPIERFLSGFINKCVNEKSMCYNCTGDILCAVEGFHAELMKMNTEHWDITKRTRGPIKQSYEATHMAPANWMCDLFEESENYIFIRYGETPEEIEKTYDDIIKVLGEHGVEKEKLDYLSKTIKVRTAHATGTKDKYLLQLKASPRHMQLLNEVYFYDNLIFGFDQLQ